jgi:hypothetical protein
MKYSLVVLIMALLGAFAFAQAKGVLLEFKYKNITVETKVMDGGKIEKTIRDFGQTNYNVQLMDLIVFKLNDKKVNAFTDVNNDFQYHVKIDPVVLDADRGNIYSIEVEIFDAKDKMVKRELFRGGKLWQDFPEDMSNELVTFIMANIK